MSAVRILGTPIVRAEDDARPCSWLISDLHIRADGGPGLDALRSLLARIAGRAAESRLLILGDLFDLFVGSRQLRLPGWREVADALAAATAGGLAVTVLHGNRDFMLDQGFVRRTGCRVVAGGLRCRLAGRDTVLLHGDELLLFDGSYQRAKRVLRHPLTRALLRAAPLGVAMRLGGGARDRSRLSMSRSGDPLRFEPAADAVRAVEVTGAELLVFGHIHRPAAGTTAAGLAYRVLPAFDAEPVALVAEGRRLAFQRVDGSAVEYAAREFARR